MKLISWNVNGIRAILKKNFNDYVLEENPDVLCLQETKAHPDQVGEVLSHYKHSFWNSAVRKGYSGTAVFTKKAPLNVTYGLGIEEHDQEGRVVTVEFESFYLVNVYTPNAQEELKRIEYRMQWDQAFLKYLKNLEKTKPVIFCGDLNVAHTEIDLANPTNNRGNPGFSDEERQGFENILKAGFLDTFREFNKDPHHYTWWSYRFQARLRNIGWRIDYFLISPSLRPSLKKAFIRDDVLGSDHCPVGIQL